MEFKLIYNPEVQNDIQSSVDWYNKQQPGLGKRFFETTKKHLSSLRNTASYYAIRYDDIHCMPIKKFPYMVHYRVDNDNKIVTVEAIFHTSQNPKKWKNRT